MDNKKQSGEHLKPINIVIPIVVAILILLVLVQYIFSQRRNIVEKIEQTTNQMAEYIASNIANQIGYAKSSIRLAAVTVAQSMESDILENPEEVILPMVANTPFGGIEYIRPDGMNVMNIGEPFDASDRVYYIEGIQGNTGIWNNFHPKTSQETLMNFYTPLVYNGKIAGVITGYIQSNTEIVPLFEERLYNQEIYGLLVDENNMVICSTLDEEYVPDFSLEMFMERFDATDEELQLIYDIFDDVENGTKTYKEAHGEGRICAAGIPGTDWKVAIIIPAKSFNAIVSENTKNAMLAIALISIILILYAAYMILRSIKKHKNMEKENAKLEEENLEIRDIISSANMGTWRIELVDGEEPRMYVDDTMKSLLGIDNKERTPEKIYIDWFENITPEAVPSVLESVEKMESGLFDENTYLWVHPTKGVRYVRCGGTAQKIPGGFALRGYHYDVDEVVREEQLQVERLQQALNEKNEYYSTLGTLKSVFYSMHVVDLIEDTVDEFNARGDVKEIVNHRDGAREMMYQVMSAVITDDFRESIHEFTNLDTLPDRMQNKEIITKQFVGKNIGWFLASCIAMDKDEEGRPTKIIFTTRVIDEEKKQEEKLIQKSQTDELTGLFNRRAYEEDIYAHNDVPDHDEFVYISIDVNGLKVVNDTLGHMAGDEIIIGACQCMKQSLGPYGKLYRIGGDEFVAIIFVAAEKVPDILAKFDATVANWQGKLVDNLSVSYGWISKDEEPEASVRQLGAIAEQRMYTEKAEYYRRSGVDRRGQQEAHKALCDLYTKILKINITEDTYHIINMNEMEQTVDKGFEETISGWLKSFGETGQVHPYDLSNYFEKTDIEYMRSYFKDKKTSLVVLYRRKYDEGYKQTMMEVIPASDYSDENQSLFLYVKSIDA